MTSTPHGPLDEPVDTAAQDDAAGPAAADRAPVSGTPAEADSDVGYSRGDAGESDEQAGGTGGAGGADYLDTDNIRGAAEDRRNG
jgi:hypothetical protein